MIKKQKTKLRCSERIVDWMAGENLTYNEVTEMFEELKKTNSIIREVAGDRPWEELPIDIIKLIPGQKERDIAAARKAIEAFEKDQEKEEEILKAKESFLDDMIKKLDKKEVLCKSEIERLVKEHSEKISSGSAGRWTIPITSIVTYKDRFFQIDWHEGREDAKDTNYLNQPFEVEKKIIKVEYVKK